MKTPFSPRAAGVLPLLLTYAGGAGFYFLQALLMNQGMARLAHPVEWLAGAGDPLLALALWNLGERLLCVLLALLPVASLLRRLLPAHAWPEWLGAGAVAGTLAWLAARHAPPSPFPPWVVLADGLLVGAALPLAGLWRRRAA